MLDIKRCVRARATCSDGGCSASQEMKHEHHDTDYEQDMNDASGDVKREESKQPENDENCSD